jgi:3-hydroxyisobutyrate dehydrogenase
MVGGEEAFFLALSPFWCAWADDRPCRPAGNGQAAKICNNMMLGVSMIAVCEAFRCRAAGLEAQTLFDISAKSSGQCWR